MKRYGNTLLVLILVFTLMMTGCKREKKSEEVAQEQFVAVEVKKPQLGQLMQHTRLSGKVASGKSVLVTAMLTAPETIKRVAVSVGDRVKVDQVLVELAGDKIDDQIKTVKNQYNLAEANYASQMEAHQNAVKNFGRIEALYKEGAVSRADYDKARLAASSKQITVLKQQLEQARTAYQIQSDQLAELTIKSPVDGTVEEVTMREDNVTSAQSYIKIIDNSALEVDFSIPEGQLKKVTLQSEVEVTIPALERTLFGTVTSISPNKSMSSNMYLATVTLNKGEAENLKSGMTAYVVVKTNLQETLLLPVDAVLVDAGDAYVYVLVTSDSVQKKSIVTGYENGEQIEILSGISKDDKVVVKGQNFIEDDTRIKTVGGE